MGVYIKGMDMPEGQHTVTITICYDGYAVVEFRDRDDYPAKIEAYQAVPVPPHGRLIDADALEDRCSRQARDEWNKSTGTNWGYAYATFESEVEDAPTIIPAESEEE